MNKSLKEFSPDKTMVPQTKFDSLSRKIKILFLAVFNKNYNSTFKHYVNLSYRKYLANAYSIETIPIAKLVDWKNITLKIIGATSNEGQTTHMELLSILALTKENIKPASSFLEIGTYDGNTSFNVAKNIPKGCKVITIDLPDVTNKIVKFEYDNFLINNPARSQKKHLKLENVQQIYSDSRELDFSQFKFNVAFIDGGHDFETVKSDTVNVLENIQHPGLIIWHDYDVECERGDLLHHMAKHHKIYHIDETRLAFTKIK